MTPHLLIQPATPDQAKAISDLAFRSKSYWGYSTEFMEACREELDVTPADIDSDNLHYYVAEQGTKILGYYAIEISSETEYELEALFVEPDHIGAGVGKALIEHAKNNALEMGGKALIIQGDPHAEKFYLAAGGKRIGTRESESISGRKLPLFKINLSNENVAKQKQSTLPGLNDA